MKKQITNQEWLELSKEDRKKYMRNCWNPKVYDLIHSAKMESEGEDV